MTSFLPLVLAVMMFSLSSDIVLTHSNDIVLTLSTSGDDVLS